MIATFTVQPTTGSVAYDTLIVVEFEGGDTLYNLTLLYYSFEPRGCSAGDEQYTMVDNRTMMLSHLLVACTAEISLAAQVTHTHIIIRFVIISLSITLQLCSCEILMLYLVRISL